MDEADRARDNELVVVNRRRQPAAGHCNRDRHGAGAGAYRLRRGLVRVTARRQPILPIDVNIGRIGNWTGKPVRIDARAQGHRGAGYRRVVYRETRAGRENLVGTVNHAKYITGDDLVMVSRVEGQPGETDVYKRQNICCMTSRCFVTNDRSPVTR